MKMTVDLAIIGAGTAGISAFKEANKVTNNIVLLDHGPLGTTCARIGCIPSKTLIQVADFFHERIQFAEQGIKGADDLKLDMQAVMKYVRKMRDSFTSGTIEYLKSLGDRFIQGNVELLESNVIKIDQKIITTKRIIIAVGSHSIVPKEWQDFSSKILTVENIFEQINFEKKIAVIGGGPIGLELGQALSRLGIEIEIFHSHSLIGGLSDPVVNEYAIETLRNEFQISTGNTAIVTKSNDSLLVENDKHQFTAKMILVAMGRKSNLEYLNFERIGISTNKNACPLYDPTTMQVGDTIIYLAGDDRETIPLLHEAVDDGHIAGYNAVRNKAHCFQRRTPIFIVFTQPNIAIVGKSFKDLREEDFIIGEVYFDSQGRSRIMKKNKGVLRIYAEKKNGKLLGAEMIAPEGEYLAHMLAWQIQQNMTVFDVLKLPFYHPVVLEGMRTALRNLATQVTKEMESFELVMCNSEAISNLS